MYDDKNNVCFIFQDYVGVKQQCKYLPINVYDDKNNVSFYFQDFRKAAKLIFANNVYDDKNNVCFYFSGFT